MLFVLMEQCNGGTLHDRLKGKKKLTPTEVFDWILQAVIAVAWLHRGGRSHDNICAKNFFFTDNTPRALLKVRGGLLVASCISKQLFFGGAGGLVWD